jgi:hypothetical protein
MTTQGSGLLPPDPNPEEELDWLNQQEEPSEVEHVDDGLGDEFEAELVRYDQGRD